MPANQIPPETEAAIQRHVDDYRRLLRGAAQRGVRFGEVGHSTLIQDFKFTTARRQDQETVKLNG
jgi:hypothetical protein